MKLKLFQQPIPIYSKGVKGRKENSLHTSNHIVRSKDMMRKAKRQIFISRPKLKHKQDCNDSYCSICADYINKLQAWRIKQ